MVYIVETVKNSVVRTKDKYFECNIFQSINPIMGLLYFPFYLYSEKAGYFVRKGIEKSEPKVKIHEQENKQKSHPFTTIMLSE